MNKSIIWIECIHGMDAAPHLQRLRLPDGLLCLSCSAFFAVLQGWRAWWNLRVIGCGSLMLKNGAPRGKPLPDFQKALLVQKSTSRLDTKMGEEN
ncbi:hypothetical protein [Mesorhizobium sp.]|uniref:hypothetical protein n=1 Tax=Mesorhizobium sp. TaxID=1871066 RepID=UPI000FE9FAE3|nr:hypothetical protein [Mesorhizobium sp.]RWP25713.1 MAG: hypothetical protein EOR01_02390 [Mesorhizobium sp.]TIS39250.1 MAG: hypothetical protein E5W95_11800 [Mesorhizobium sp.]